MARRGEGVKKNVITTPLLRHAFGAYPLNGDGLLFCPVLDLQFWNPSEFDLIVGDKNAFQGESMGGNQHIKRADRRALAFQMGSQLSVLLSRHIVIRNDLDWSKEFGQGQLVLLRLTALCNSVLELAERNRRDSDVRDMIALKATKDLLGLLPYDVDTDIRVQHVLDHRPSLFC